MEITPLLPFIFAGLLGVSILLYVILDGFDLGIGILCLRAPAEHRPQLLASIGPFWDANETWLVLSVGILLIAFPVAHGMILSQLYLPVALMLLGIILRGVAYELCIKSEELKRKLWEKTFFIGSLLTALCQGFMLGLYTTGLTKNPVTISFSLMTALCLVAGYQYIGGAWLILKTSGDVQKIAVAWAKKSLVLVAIGMVAISLATPFASPRIFHKWFDFPQIIPLSLFPLTSLLIFVMLMKILAQLPKPEDRHAWVPFAGGVALFVLSFCGLAYSFIPYIVPEKITIAAAAAAPASLKLTLIGVLCVLPAIFLYTIFVHRVFRGKIHDLSHEY